MKRLIERIPIIAKALETPQNKTRFIRMILPDLPIEYIEKWQENVLWVEFWEDHPYLRLTQVLVNLEIIPNFPGAWYYKEDVDLVLESGLLQKRDILLWGTRVGENLVFKPIKDLETSHIEAILGDNEEGLLNVNKELLKEFWVELKTRKTNI